MLKTLRKGGSIGLVWFLFPWNASFYCVWRLFYFKTFP